MQSDFGQKFLKERGLKSDDFDTIYLWKPDAFYLTKSDAILKIANTIGGIYNLATILKIFPKFTRDIGYNLIAKIEKKINGTGVFATYARTEKKICIVICLYNFINTKTIFITKNSQQK